MINDAFDLSQAGIVFATRPFEIIKYLSKESEYLPWSVSMSKLTSISNVLETTTLFGSYVKYVTNLIKPLYDRLQWNENQFNSWLDK